MLSLFVDTAHAMGGAGGGAAAQGQNPIMGILPFIMIMVVFYFFMIRPQQKKAKEHQAMLEAIERGDDVVTGGGIIGKVTGVTEETLTLEIAQNVKVKVQRRAIAQVLNKG